jgi:hypothetical protein
LEDIKQEKLISELKSTVSKLGNDYEILLKENEKLKNSSCDFERYYFIHKCIDILHTFENIVNVLNYISVISYH